MNNRNNNNKGFTLIEVLIAMAIFAIGMLAVASMQTNAIMKTTSARDLTDALELASGHVEFLQGLPLYDENLDLDGEDGVEQFDFPPELDVGDHEIQVEGYTIQWTVTDDEPLPAIVNVYSTTGPDPLTISKTIEVTIFETRNPNRIMAQLEMVKIWDQDG